MWVPNGLLHLFLSLQVFSSIGRGDHPRGIENYSTDRGVDGWRKSQLCSSTASQHRLDWAHKAPVSFKRVL